MKPLSGTHPGFAKVRLRAIGRILGHFGRHLRPHWRALLAAWLCTLGMSAMELLRPWPMKVIFDVILGAPAKRTFLDLLPFRGASSGVLLASLAISILIIAVLSGLFAYAQAYVITSVGQRVVAAIRRQLYSHIQRLSHSFHDTHHSGDLLMRLTGDIGLLRELMVGSGLDLGDRLVVLLGMIGIMVWMDWQLSLIALGILPFLVIAVSRFSGRIRRTAKEQRRNESQIASILSERISAIKIVQAFTREAHEDEGFSRQDEASLKAGLRASRLEMSLNRLVELLVAVATCGVVWFGVRRVLAGVLTPGDLLVFTAYLTGLYKPVRKLASLTSRISKATACGERIISILETEPQVRDAPDAIVAPPFRGEITFEEVEFRYLPDEPVLNGISFTIKPGQTAALVGPSGVGKSTVANLLLRFYDPQKGRVLVDGTDIRRYTLASLREQVAVVLQEPLLFNTSVRDNIAYGNLDASMEEIVSAARAANAHDFIQELEDGYGTVLSERGGSLSRGQRQRIAIARALIRNAPIVVLDEPMTGLDADSEARVQEALRRLTRGKTCLLITHNLEAAERADLVLVLRRSGIAERGRHPDLAGRTRPHRELSDPGTGPSRVWEHVASGAGDARQAPLAAPPRYEPALLRQLGTAMSSVAMTEILRRDWPYLRRRDVILTDCCVARVYPQDGQGFVLEYDMHFLGEHGATVQRFFGLLLGNEAANRCAALAKKLTKRSQLPLDGRMDLVTCFPDLGLILQFSGLDHRLHGLKPALDPAVMRRILRPYLSLDGSDSPECAIDILGHRLGKRCVLRYRFEGLDARTGRRARRSFIGKLYKARDDKGRQVFEVMRQLWEHGFDDLAPDGIRIPKPLAYVPDWALLLMEDTQGTPVTASGGPPLGLAVEPAARALAKLHRCSLTVPARYTATDELELLNGWVTVVSQVHPDMKAGVEEALARVRDAIGRCPSVEATLTHRDFYEKQVLLNGNQIALIDFDTLCLADPAIDVGNFLAHLKLACLHHRGGTDRPEEAFLATYDRVHPPDFSARVAIYFTSSLLRLACLYSLWPQRSDLARPLLEALLSSREASAPGRSSCPPSRPAARGNRDDPREEPAGDAREKEGHR